MSLYRDAERQRRKRWRQQQRKRGGKKSSLGAALSASLTALFVGGSKDSAPSSDCEDNGYYYGAGSSATDADRVEYVTVRGCRPSRDDSCDELSTDDENHEAYDSDFDGDDAYNHTKGMAQMAVTLGEYKRFLFLIFLPTKTYTAECYYLRQCLWLLLLSLLSLLLSWLFLSYDRRNDIKTRVYQVRF